MACMSAQGGPPHPSAIRAPAALQSRGLKLNPVTTLYFVAPCCFCFLLVRTDAGLRGPLVGCSGCNVALPQRGRCPHGLLFLCGCLVACALALALVGTHLCAPLLTSFLQVPFVFLEAGKIASDPNLDLNPFIFVTNALAAFGEPCATLCRMLPPRSRPLPRPCTSFAAARLSACCVSPGPRLKSPFCPRPHTALTSPHPCRPQHGCYDRPDPYWQWPIV